MVLFLGIRQRSARYIFLHRIDRRIVFIYMPSYAYKRDLCFRLLQIFVEFFQQNNTMYIQINSYFIFQFVCCLYLAFPYTTVSVERSFSALQRIKNSSRYKMGESRLSYFNSIEKKFFTSSNQENVFMIQLYMTSLRKLEEQVKLMYK